MELQSYDHLFVPLSANENNNIKSTKCADSDHPAHVQSIIQTFALHLYIP